MYKILLDDVVRDVALHYDDAEWSGAMCASVMGELFDVVYDVTLLYDDVTGERCVPR